MTGQTIFNPQELIWKPQSNPVNAMTVDVEDYFQVSAFENTIDRADWNDLPLRVGRNMERILALYDRYDIKATFFVLGWVAERLPSMVQDVVAAGHELASHGYGHERVTTMTPGEFREDLLRAKGILEDLGGVSIKGYRAPSYSIGRDNLWALDVLQETGHQYSSSIYPIHHDLYGMPEAPRFPFFHKPGGLLEIPITTVMLADKPMPCGGGGYFRLFPYALSRWALQKVHRNDGKPCVFYYHPWEIDPNQPRQTDAGFKSRFRHYLNLSRMEGRVEQLLKDFQWDRMDRVFLEPALKQAA